MQPKWKATTCERYWEMLECLPPAMMTGLGFLVGEPMDHFSATRHARYSAFAQIGDDYFEAVEPMTRAAFKAITRDDIRANVEA